MRIGIYGGTFDPIHKGHMETARAVLEGAALDKIIFMPSGDPPHKVDRQLTSAIMRYKMVRSAVNEYNEERFEVSDIEVKRDGYSYTYDTLCELRETYPEATLYWIIGADVLGELDRWFRYEEVFTLCSFIAMCRPGHDKMRMKLECAEQIKKGARIEFIDVPLIDISSTSIRERAKAGESLEGLVPQSVAEMITRESIYKRSVIYWIPEDIQVDLEKHLSPERYKHSIGVMEECMRIAGIYGGDTTKCALAGLLHDCAREMSHAQYIWLGLDVNKIREQTPYRGMYETLLHGEASALVAAKRYGIDDPEILDAIKTHTLGKPGMSRTAQILFVSDYTEEGRVGEDFMIVREALKKSLIHAVAEECRLAIKYRASMPGSPICIDTVETYNWALIKKRDSDVSSAMV